MKQGVIIKSNKTGLTIILDPDIDFQSILDELKIKFIKAENFWGTGTVTLNIEGRSLTWKEQVDLVNTITENSELEILCILDSDYKIVEKSKNAFLKYYREFNNLSASIHPGSLRGDEQLESESSIIIIGDVYENTVIKSGGSVIVLGELAGSVSAGIGGNKDAYVVAFSMNTNNISIGGLSTQEVNAKGLGLKKPAAWSVEDNQVCLKLIKKSFLNALKHKKCW